MRHQDPHFPSRGLDSSVVPRSGAAVLLVCICCRQCEQPRVILPEPQRHPSELLGSHETQANLAFTCCQTHGALLPAARHVVSSCENDQMDGKSCLVPLVVPFCFQSTLNSSIMGIKPLSSGESGLPAGDQCPELWKERQTCNHLQVVCSRTFMPPNTLLHV